MRFFWLALVLLMTGCQDEGKVIREEITGYRGEARLNPYLAAEKYLDAQGFEAKSSRVWPENKDGLNMIVVPLSFIKTKGIAMRILEWVEEGGTLVVTMSGGEAGRNDFTSGESDGDGLFSIEEDEAAGETFFLEQLRVTTALTDWSDLCVVDEIEEDGHLSRPWHLTRLEEDYGDYQLEFEGEIGLQTGFGRPWELERNGNARIVEAFHGAGSVVMLGHARPFRNPYLARADHAEFLEMLVEYGGSDSVVFLYGAGDSFFAMLWSRGWRFVVAGLVLLLVWLWMRIPRFGPVLADLEVTQKPYGESLLASARYLWRSGQMKALVLPLQQRIDREGQGSISTRAERLAEECDLDAEEVASSLQPIISKDPNTLLKTVQRLQTLLKR